MTVELWLVEEEDISSVRVTGITAESDGKRKQT